MGIFRTNWLECDPFCTDLTNIFNPFTPKSDLIDFNLSNDRWFYSSKGDPLGVKALKNYLP